MGTTGHHGAHECRALGSAGVCSELCLCAAAGGAQDREEPGLEGVLEHGCGSGRSDSRPLRASGPGTRGWRASGGEAWAGAKRNAQSQPALARLLLRNALSGWGLPGHPLRQKGKPPPRRSARGADSLQGGVIRYQTKPTHACGRVRVVGVGRGCARSRIRDPPSCARKASKCTINRS